jgi:hypothetical protein
MISVKPDLVLGVILVALLSTPTAYARQAQIQLRTQTQPAAEVKPSSTTNGTTATQELVPLSAPATEPKEPATPPQTSTSTVRPSSDADDPRAVIDWLLNRSR